MNWKKIPYHDQMTKGESSDLIQSYMDKKEAYKRAKGEEKATIY